MSSPRIQRTGSVIIIEVYISPPSTSHNDNTCCCPSSLKTFYQMPRISLGIIPIRCDCSLPYYSSRLNSCASILPRGILYIRSDLKANPRRAYSSWREGKGQRNMGQKPRQGPGSKSDYPPKPSSRYVYARGFMYPFLEETGECIYSKGESNT